VAINNRPDRSGSKLAGRWLRLFGRVLLVTLTVILLRMLCFAVTGNTLDVSSGQKVGQWNLVHFWSFDTVRYWAKFAWLASACRTLGCLLFRTYGPRVIFDAATGITVWVLASCLVYELLFGRQAAPEDGESRCRRCSYILRGLSAPRCPECGEPI
jgi:hypothetical protein